MNLKNRWEQFASQIEANKNIDLVWSWIESAYNEENRFYHNFNHIEQCLKEFDLFSHLREDRFKLIIEFAIWFHDIIYNTKSNTNELDSAELAKNAFGVLEVGQEFKYQMMQEIANYILNTTHKGNSYNFSQQLFLDIDLSILGQTANVFDEYESNIRKEYEWVPIKIYKEKRIEILQKFIGKPSIFMTTQLCEKYEKQARDNIFNSLKMLRS